MPDHNQLPHKANLLANPARLANGHAQTLEMIPLLAALLGCLALSRGQARASEAGAALTPDMVFTTPEQPAGEQSNGKAAAMLAPNTAINDTAAVGPPLESVLSAQACSSACRATPKCQLFKWCGVTVSLPVGEARAAADGWAADGGASPRIAGRRR